MLKELIKTAELHVDSKYCMTTNCSVFDPKSADFFAWIFYPYPIPQCLHNITLQIDLMNFDFLNFQKKGEAILSVGGWVGAQSMAAISRDHKKTKIN